jgi:Cu+-exporting ATPase
MTCAVGCAKTIQEKLTDLDGVQTATVDFETKSAMVTFDKTIQTPETLTKVVQATGDGKTYTVSNMKS